METEECPQGHPEGRHQTPQWQSRVTIIPEALGFLISCDMRLLPLGEFAHVARLMLKAAGDYLKEEGIIIETKAPALRLVKSD
jgi:hypothetical protein